MEIQISGNTATFTVCQDGYTEVVRLAVKAGVKNPLPPFPTGPRHTLRAGFLSADPGTATFNVPHTADIDAILKVWNDEARADALARQQWAEKQRAKELAASGRYIVVSESQSAHCCFEATVVDTTKPVMIGGKHYEGQFESVCECFDEDDAVRIAAALNAAEVSQ